MNLTINNLESCFNAAYQNKSNFVAVKVQMQGFEKPDIIINQFDNIKEKLAYYKKAYNDNLTLKTFSGIKIIGFTHGNSFKDIQDGLA